MLLYKIIGVIGLVFIIAGNLTIHKNKTVRRKYTYPLLIAGGIFLEIYSIYLGDRIFMTLQGIFIIAAIYGMIKINRRCKEMISS